MGNYTIVIHGTGAHHNWSLEPDPKHPERGNTYISGRANDYDADLLFAEFVDHLKAKGHNITGATFTHGGMEGADNVIRKDYQNPHLPKRPEAPFVYGVYELRSGGGHVMEEKRFFSQCNMVDAVVRLSERVKLLDDDPTISAAFASLRLVKSDGSDGDYGGQSLASWTKCSDERPTSAGALTLEEVGPT